MFASVKIGSVAMFTITGAVRITGIVSLAPGTLAPLSMWMRNAAVCFSFMLSRAQPETSASAAISDK